MVVRFFDAAGNMTSPFAIDQLVAGSTTGARTILTGNNTAIYAVNCDGSGVVTGGDAAGRDAGDSGGRLCEFAGHCEGREADGDDDSGHFAALFDGDGAVHFPRWIGFEEPGWQSVDVLLEDGAGEPGGLDPGRVDGDADGARAIGCLAWTLGVPGPAADTCWDMLTIRAAVPEDRAAIWAVLEPVIRAGETYALPRDLSFDEGLGYWFAAGNAVFVAEAEGRVVGTYLLRANQRGGGGHVANCGYMTAGDFKGRGVARAMCEHSLEVARGGGFRAMQFNFVVSTNERAVRLWESCGFAVVGRLPGAFAHPVLGFVDALVMFRTL